MGRFFLFLKFAFFLSFFFIFSSPCFAVMTLTFSNASSSVEGEEAFEVDVSLLSAPKNKTYYLRAVFYEEGKTQYFGYTFNHEGNWHNSSGEYTKFLEINTGDEEEWIGKLKAKADLQDSAYKGVGNYQFKIGRYTEGGSLSWSENNAAITITAFPTPTPTLSSTPTPTMTPTPTPIPTPTVAPTPSPYTGGGISLNEFMPNPSEGEEWVEIKNENDFEVSLEDWSIDDIADGGSSPVEFSITIQAHSYVVIETGKYYFNNNGDTVRLLKQGGEEIEMYPYASSRKGYSFAKDADGNWQETSDPTPGEENSIVGFSTPQPEAGRPLDGTPTPVSTPTPQPKADRPLDGTPGSNLVLGMSSGSSVNSATDSGYLVDLMCPLIEELETKFQIQKNDNLGQNTGGEEKKDINETRPHVRYVLLLGLAAAVGSFGSLLKETSFLVKWWHELFSKV